MKKNSIFLRWSLRILDIHDFISDMVLLHAKNKAVSLKDANNVVHVLKKINVNTPKTSILAYFRVIYI